MGFDLFGRKPSAQHGKHFRRGGWGPLADYIRSVAPDITAKCTYWYSNDGDGLTARQTTALADRIDEEISNGRCALYMRAHSHFSGGVLNVETVKEFVAFLRASGGFDIY